MALDLALAARIELAATMRRQGVDAKELTQLRVTAPKSADEAQGVYDLVADHGHVGECLWPSRVWAKGQMKLYRTATQGWVVVGNWVFEFEPNIKVALAHPDAVSVSVPVQWLSTVTGVRDMEKVLDDGAYSDFTVQLKGGSTIAVHKCIMAARCGVAEGILRTGDRAPGGDLDIDDLDPADAQHMVKFIYTGRLGRNVKPLSCAALAAAADKYKVPDLEAASIAAMRDGFRDDPSSVWSVLSLPSNSADVVQSCLRVVAGLGMSPETVAQVTRLSAAGHSLTAAATFALATGKVNEDFVVGAAGAGAEPAAKRQRAGGGSQ